MLSLYKIYRPRVEYSASARNCFRKCKKRFTKMIVNMDGLSYEERLNRLKLWSLEERRNRQDLIEVF